MFALLAMAGDLGGAFGPGLVGNIAQNANNNLQKGMLVGCIAQQTKTARTHHKFYQI